MKENLRFILEEYIKSVEVVCSNLIRKIYAIPYDDIGYPENAIKIMSNEIIWNLMKQKV